MPDAKQILCLWYPRGPQMVLNFVFLKDIMSILQYTIDFHHKYTILILKIPVILRKYWLIIRWLFFLKAEGNMSG